MSYLTITPRCRICGCTDLRPCPGGCYWVEIDLCSRCADQEMDETALAWVPVTAMLPQREYHDSTGPVLIYETFDRVGVPPVMLIAYYAYDRDIWFRYRSAGEKLTGTVTHWQPLPAPPIGDY